MANHRGRRLLPECMEQPKLIAHRVQQTERSQVRLGVIVRVPAGGTAIAAKVWCDDMESGIRQRRHHVAP